MGVAYWLGGALDALVVGLGALLAALISAAIELYRHEVTMQEAIKFVERVADNGKKEATRRLHLPRLFSLREERTGEMGEGA